MKKLVIIQENKRIVFFDNREDMQEHIKLLQKVKVDYTLFTQELEIPNIFVSPKGHEEVVSILKAMLYAYDVGQDATRTSAIGRARTFFRKRYGLPEYAVSRKDLIKALEKSGTTIDEVSEKVKAGTLWLG